MLFCMQLYKIDAVTFDHWMTLLNQSPGASLWLLKFPPVAVANIKREARKRGVGAMVLCTCIHAYMHMYNLLCCPYDFFLSMSSTAF